MQQRIKGGHPMKVLVVMAHPRRDSLTGQIADAVVAGLQEAGHETELADLYGEGFDPLIMPPDEPDWGREDKVYSESTQAEIARLQRNDGLVLVFPIWWWSFPAIMKGWVDRVWNKDVAYGANTLNHKRALAIGLSASNAEQYAKRDYDKAIETQIVTGIFDFCGIKDGRFEYLHHSTDGGERPAEMIAEARVLGRTFADGL
jgi:NAD(P)H dehydrogenase (quinone)